MKFGKTILVATWLLSIAGGAVADSIPLFNTGVDGVGNILPGGATDTHWTIVAGTGITSPVAATVLRNPPGSYATTSDSRWLWRNADGSGGGTSTFRISFDLTGYDATTASLSGSWGTDNNGQILLNGANAVGVGALALTGASLANFNILHAFTITGGFVAGLNTLDFFVVDTGAPGAFNARGLIVNATPSAVPEPHSLIAMALGTIGVAGATRFRRGVARG